MTINEVIEKLVGYYPPQKGAPRNDTIKWGSGDRVCTGIGITCFASADVIRQAKEQNINLIICHECVFWNNDDTVDQYAGNPVCDAKKRLLEESGVTIWRNHDHIHGSPPMKEGKTFMDGIFEGIMLELGWKPYLKRWDNMPLMYEIPETTAGALAQELLEKFNLTGMRVVGDINTPVKVVYFCEHVQGRQMGGPGGKPGGKYKEDDELIQMVIDYDVDVLIPLEIIDWTATSFIRDSTQLGRPRAILEMGHFNVEELGMRAMLRFLPQLVGDSIPVAYLQSGDTFGYVTRK